MAQHFRPLCWFIIPKQHSIVPFLLHLDIGRRIVLNTGEWFALQVRTRTEHQVAAMLRFKGYEEFLPTHNVRKKSVLSPVPLFPGYVFCRINAHVYGLIVTTPGVIRVVEFGGKPAPIDPEEIRSIQLIVNSGVPISVWKGLNVGDKIRIEEGPLQGAVGVLASIRPKRLLVSISMMMRTVVAEVDPEWVSSVGLTLPRYPPASANQKPMLRCSA
jgi:transcription antitermination factor NusG